MSGVVSIVLVVHMLIVVALIGVVLLQRSEGGALGIGGGSGSFLSAAGAGNALTRATMILAAMFFGTSILLTVLSRSPNKELDLKTQTNGKVAAPQPAGSGGPQSAPQSAPQPPAPAGTGGPGPQAAPGQPVAPTGGSPPSPVSAPGQSPAPAGAPAPTAGSNQPAPQPAKPPQP
ncbi:MAG: preprotein translocase subunit SecG [Alphaproteobacteria bacterium]